MFLRCHRRKKDGKEHRYFSVEESRRLQSGKVVQRRVLYLGEVNDSQQAAWRKTLEVFDERQQRATTLSLFAEDRPVPTDALDAIQVKLSCTWSTVGVHPLGIIPGSKIVIGSCVMRKEG